MCICAGCDGGPAHIEWSYTKREKEKKRRKNNREHNVNGYYKDSQENFESLNHKFGSSFSLMTSFINFRARIAAFGLAAELTKTITYSVPLVHLWSNPNPSGHEQA